MEEYVKEAMTSSGCTEGLVRALFTYFDNNTNTRMTGVVNGASYKYYLSPITVINVYRIWLKSGGK